MPFLPFLLFRFCFCAGGSGKGAGAACGAAGSTVEPTDCAAAAAGGCGVVLSVLCAISLPTRSSTLVNSTFTVSATAVLISVSPNDMVVCIADGALLLVALGRPLSSAGSKTVLLLRPAQGEVGDLLSCWSPSELVEEEVGDGGVVLWCCSIGVVAATVADTCECI